MLKSHLDMIGRNEPIQRKARFWQSYVRALKGTDDMRAPERSSSRPRGIFRPLLTDYPELGSSWPYNKSIYDDPTYAVDRIAVPGYRYLPVSRETYGYSPRNLYPTPYRPAPVYDARKAWDDHLKRLADIDRIYPSKYPLSARHATPSPKKELEPEDKIEYNYAGIPLFSRGGYTRRPLMELLQPITSMPLSRYARDPWWWAYPSLRPYTLPYGWNKTPFYLRDSYLSPVKRTYLWGQHPIRPFGPYYCLSKSKRDLEESVRRADTAEDLYRTESVISNKIALAKHNSEVKNIEEKRKSALYYLPTGDPWWSVYSKIKPHKVLEVPAPESPLKDIYHWKDHPFRALGPTSRAFYYYLWRRSVWEDKLADFDYKVRDTYSPPAHLIYV